MLKKYSKKEKYLIIGGIVLFLSIASFLLFSYIEERRLEDFVNKDIEQRHEHDDYMIHFINQQDRYANVSYDDEENDKSYWSFYQKNNDGDWLHRNTLETSEE